jgi:predicted kinase
MKAVIVDIDGTVADCRHRLHHVTHGYRNYDEFYAELVNDPPIQDVVDLVNIIYATKTAVVMCSGRPEDYREATEKWLQDNGVFYDILYMRPSGDFRPDYVIKKQLLDGIIEDGYEIILTIDDRQSVVDMWRENGLTCLQAVPQDHSIPDHATLTLMVGPSGAGKSTWLLKNTPPRHVLSSDDLRQDIAGDFRSQESNPKVYDAIHALVKVRMKHALPTVVDATNIRRKDRMALARLAPNVEYIVLNRSMEEKRRTGGWRNHCEKNGEPDDLMGRHEEVFKMNLKYILNGDGLDHVKVYDYREYKG